MSKYKANINVLTPKEYQTLGKALKLFYGQAMTPFGKALIAWSDKGICFLAFGTDEELLYKELDRKWGLAFMTQDASSAQSYLDRVFVAKEALDLCLKGTLLQISVWKALLDISYGSTMNYSQIAKIVKNSKAIRAVASAIGANDIAYLIPCHRVIAKDGGMGGYRWGVEIKRLLLSYEQLNSKNSKIYELYQKLFHLYGPQGWWPILNKDGEVLYHPSDYTFPRNEAERFEICLGSILTQNTTFTSVVASLKNLQTLDALSIDGMKSIDLERFKKAIRPSGYFNQKSEYIFTFIAFFESLQGSVPTREALLALKGIGEETADSILLYAYNQFHIKVDAYTKRLLVHLGMVDEKAKYAKIKQMMEGALQEYVDDNNELLKAYQELHALIVHHGKQFYSKKPYGVGCTLGF